VCFCFSFSVLSQEIGWEEHLLYCVGWDIKRKLNQSINGINVCNCCQAAAAADVTGSHLMAAANDEDSDGVQLNGVMMNGHDDKPFRSVLCSVFS